MKLTMGGDKGRTKERAEACLGSDKSQHASGDRALMVGGGGIRMGCKREESGIREWVTPLILLLTSLKSNIKIFA